MAVSEKMKNFSEKSSWIRKMFEEGARLKAEYGSDQVFDFSIGNPDIPPPHQFRETMIEIASEDTPGQHGYMPNGGCPGFGRPLLRGCRQNRKLWLIKEIY